MRIGDEKGRAGIELFHVTSRSDNSKPSNSLVQSQLSVFSDFYSNRNALCDL